MKRFIVALSLLLCGSWLGCSYSVYAQTAPGAITVEPSSLEFRLEQGESQQFEVKIQNEYDTSVTLQAELQSIEGDSGRILPAGPLSAELASAIKISEGRLTIPARETRTLTVTAQDTATLAAGGQYASLVISNLTGEGEVSSVRPQISVGIFLIKKQGEIQKIELSKIELARKRFQFPTRLGLEFINDGNVHLVPRGYVRVQDKGTVYFEAILNMQSQMILPNERFSQELSLYANPSGLFPRIVSFEMGYRADGMEEVKIYREEFWYVPWFVPPVLIVLLCGAGYFAFFLAKKHTKD